VGVRFQEDAMRRYVTCAAVLATAFFGMSVPAQEVSPLTGVGDEFSASWMAEHVPALMEKAQTSEDGSATFVMHRYPGNQLNLMVRVRTGICEMHANFTDILVAIDGEADIITGGTIVDRKELNNGESRGSRSEGGLHHHMRKGDIIHILPSTPHWTVLEPGKTFTFWAAKIETPHQGVLPVTR
jgi:hypothetical protein